MSDDLQGQASNLRLVPFLFAGEWHTKILASLEGDLPFERWLRHNSDMGYLLRWPEPGPGPEPMPGPDPWPEPEPPEPQP